MERLRSVTLAAVMAALAPGCIHVHKDAAGNVKSVELKTGAEPAADAGVKQASATVPAAAVPAAASGMAKLATKMPSFGGGTQAAFLHLNWQNRIAKLPDPTAEGKFKPGLVGQMFLFSGGQKMLPIANPDGKLTVELFDASPRAGTAEPVRLGSWTFEKDVLARLVTTDERFGKSFALFLPWPTYTPSVSRVMLMAKYEPDQGFALHAEPMTMTIDTSVGADGPVIERSSSTRMPGAVSPSLPPASMSAPPAPVAPGVPGGLPPLTITLPNR
ncbi:hypothetical protein [Urbifossiella limnaea]|uniref:Uncharacterized protein n=1 Tax=Urbifossiella limnaea TaxID=2528023 RepID=A0A517Y1L6_9BACT|nr:hypothetical protein [Urbifossiella limnaea]QDU23633.1 hypothetical protein ETAA1_56370 [Urbifossiella limnaea]